MHDDVLFADASKLQLIAAAFWSTDYKPIFDAEFVANEQECGGQAAMLAPTSYRQRLSGAAAERYDMRRRSQQRDAMAIRLPAQVQDRLAPGLAPIRPEIVVLSFENCELAAEWTPVCADELVALSSQGIKGWPDEIHVARSFAFEEGPSKWFIGTINKKAKTAAKHFWAKFAEDEPEYKVPRLSSEPLAVPQKNGYGGHWLLVKPMTMRG